MSPLEVVTRAIASAPDDRARARAALDALRDPVIDAFARDNPSKIDALREVWRNQIELPR